MRITPRGWLWVAAVGVLIAAAGGVLGWVVFPWAVHQQVGQQLALKEGSDAWDRWVSLPLPLSMELRIFHVTNPDEVYKGANPQFQEMGPYVYRQYRNKYQVEVNEEDDTVSYYQKLIHVFDEDLSGGLKESDVVTIINPALMSMLNIMTNIPVLAKGASFMDQAAPLLFGSSNVFLTTTAGELLFRGVRIPCSTVMNKTDSAVNLSRLRSSGLSPEKMAGLAALVACASMKRIKVKTITEESNGDLMFSLFGYKNNTFDGRYTVSRGVKKPAELAQITAWEGSSFVSAWGALTCNAVNGTQGDIFSPYVTKETVIDVFSTDICRSMAITYLEDSSYRGISAYRFSPGSEVMMDVLHNGNNYCFCPQVAKGLTKENGCLRRGALDVSGCQGIPVIISYPHFFDADPYYLEKVDGLKPQEDLHRMVVDIEPITGTPLKGGKRMQLNFQMRHYDGLNITTGLRDTLMPVAWMYEGVALDDDLIQLLNSLLINILKILNGIKYALLALGGLLFLVGLLQYFRTRRAAKARRAERKAKPNGVSNGRSKNGDVSMNLTPSAVTPETVPPRSLSTEEVEGYSRHN